MPTTTARATQHRMCSGGVLAALIFACATSTAVSAASSPVPAPADPAATVDAFHSALHDGKADAALSLLAANVQIFEQGFVEQARDSYKGAHLNADIDFARKTEFKVLDRNIVWLGSGAACVMSRTTTQGDFQGHPIDLVGTETMLLQKAGDGWVIQHIHWSAHPREQDGGSGGMQ